MHQYLYDARKELLKQRASIKRDFYMSPNTANALKNAKDMLKVVDFKIKNIKRIGNFSKGSGLNIYDKNHQNLNLVKKGFSHF